MLGFNPYTISSMPTTEEEIKKCISDISIRIRFITNEQFYSDRTIFDDYHDCQRCYKVFQILELLEKYHEFLKTHIKMFDSYFVLRKKIRTFIKEVQNQDDKCKCCISEEIDYIDEDTGFIRLTEDEDERDSWKRSLINHYYRLVNEPNVLNEEVVNNSGCGWKNKINVVEYDDNHLGLIFNNDDQIQTYHGEYTPYNTRQQYRLQQRNFLKLSINSYISNNHTFVTSVVELHRDRNLIIKELEFWDEYFSKPHTLLVTSVLSLKGKINNDCIYNIIGFLKSDKLRSVVGRT